MKLIFVVTVILGLFEFFAAYEFWFGDEAALLGKHGLLPPVFITDARYVIDDYMPHKISFTCFYFPRVHTVA